MNLLGFVGRYTEYSAPLLQDKWAGLGLFAVMVFGMSQWRLARKRGRAGRIRDLVAGWPRTLTTKIFPRGAYLHPSTYFDLKLQFFGLLFGHGFLVGLLGVRTFLLDDLVGQQVGYFSKLVKAVNPIAGMTFWSFRGFWINAFWALFAAALYDLARTLVHFALHKIPALWEIHKIHHSAEVLTPLNDFRGHIIERILKELLGGVLVVTGTELFVTLFGPHSVSPVTSLGWNISAFFAANLFTWLSHSHVWCNLGIFGLFIANPAGHLIHHSAELRHRDKNFADVFPIWDLLLGTLYIPRVEEHFKIGVRDARGKRWVPTSISQVLFGCVLDGVRVVIGRPAPRHAPATKDGIQVCWCGPECKEVAYAMDNPAPPPRGWSSLRELAGGEPIAWGSPGSWTR